MSEKPGADELHIRDLLIQHGVGPDAEPPAPPAHEQPDEDEPPQDWLDDILDGNASAPEEPSAPVEPEPKDAEPKANEPKPPKKPKAKAARKRKRKRSKRRDPAAPRTAWDDHPQDPRQSLLDAWDRIPYRLKWLFCHATAAAAGYRLGWVDYSTRTAAWIADHGRTSPSALFWYGVAIGCALLQRRLRNHHVIVRWLAAVPIASIATGTALYGTDWMNFHLELPL